MLWAIVNFLLFVALLIRFLRAPVRDYFRARGDRLAEGLAALPGVKIDPEKVVTNIVIFDVAETGMTADAICAQLRERGVLGSGFGSAIRMVTHYDVSRADIETALQEMRSVLAH